MLDTVQIWTYFILRKPYEISAILQGRKLTPRLSQNLLKLLVESWFTAGGWDPEPSSPPLCCMCPSKRGEFRSSETGAVAPVSPQSVWAGNWWEQTACNRGKQIWPHRAINEEKKHLQSYTFNLHDILEGGYLHFHFTVKESEGWERFRGFPGLTVNYGQQDSHSAILSDPRLPAFSICGKCLWSLLSQTHRLEAWI